MAFLDDRDLSEIGQKVAVWLGEQRGETLTAVDVQAPMGTGFSSETLIFDVQREDGSKEGVVARLEPDEYIMFPDYDIPLQYKLIDALQSTNIPVPKTLGLQADKSYLGVPFYVMNKIIGQVPSDNPPMHDEGWIADELNEEQRATLWWNGFNAMCDVHKLEYRELGLEFLDEPARGNTPLEQQLHYYEEYFTWAGDRARYPVTQRALDYLHANIPTDESTALCWGDSRLANQMFDGLNCVAVLDWEMARLGNPVQDLAWWINADRCFTEGLEIKRLPGFPSKEETVAKWAETTGFSTEHLHYYEVLALMRFSINMARVGQHMKRIEMIDEENEFDTVNLASIILERVLDEA